MDILLQNPQYTERIKEIEDYIGELSYRTINEGETGLWTKILYAQKCIHAMECEMNEGFKL